MSVIVSARSIRFRKPKYQPNTTSDFPAIGCIEYILPWPTRTHNKQYFQRQTAKLLEVFSTAYNGRFAQTISRKLKPTHNGWCGGSLTLKHFAFYPVRLLCEFDSKCECNILSRWFKNYIYIYEGRSIKTFDIHVLLQPYLLDLLFYASNKSYILYKKVLLRNCYVITTIINKSI